MSDRRVALGAAIAVIVALVGLAVGRGWSPGDVFDEAASTPAIEPGESAVVAEDATDDGHSIGLWFGPSTAGDQVCVLIRTIWPVGTVDSSPVCGAPLLPWSADGFDIRTNSQYFGRVDETPIGSVEDGFAVVGLTGAVHPEVTAVTARFGDGAEYSFSPRPPDGWFAVVLPDAVADLDRVDGHLVNGLVSLELFDAEGRVLTTVDDPALLP